MDRIDSFNAVDLGGGKLGFQDQILSSGSGSQEGTWVSADWLNGIQEELMTLIEAAGLVGDKAKFNLLGEAIQSGRLNYCDAGGTVNDITASLTLAPNSLKLGMRVNVKLIGPSTGVMTFNLNSLGPHGVVLADGSPVPSGSGRLGQIARFVWDGTNWQWPNFRAATQTEATAGTAANVFLTPSSQRTTPAVILIAGNSGSNSIPTGVHTLLTTFAVSSNGLRDSTFAGGKLTIGAKDAGTWLFIFNGGVPALNKAQKLTIWKNGAIYNGAQSVGNSTDSGSAPAACSFSVSAGDYVQFGCYQNTGSTQVVSDANVSCIRLGA